MYTELKEMDTLQELQGYQTEPKQMKAAAKGKIGILELTFDRQNEKTILTHLYRVAPLLVQQALYWDESWPELPICSIISVGGGIIQGDRYFIEINVNDNAFARISTQSATRVQEMDANYATQYQQITVGKKGYLEYIPDTTILYKNSRFACENKIIIDQSSVLLYGETIMLGRKHHKDERYEFELFSSSLKVYLPSGELIFHEKLLIGKNDPIKDYNAVMKDYDVFSNIVCLCPQPIIDQIITSYKFNHDKELNTISGISLLPNGCGVILRVIGKESYHVHDKINKFTELVKNISHNYLQ
ncbi:urease accessory protein UreD [Photobacterium phosphoreum]|uniref:urease accessory protein UreD n=1 Tax=Photobacterium phosphoreum TaxID=659 RepID=UPI0024B9CD79|nr:urease accessory protein UreD [Photobacterium phosphoreum]